MFDNKHLIKGRWSMAYTCLLIMYPILSVYNVNNVWEYPITVGDLLMGIFILAAMVKCKRLVLNSSFLPYYLYILFHLLFLLLLGTKIDYYDSVGTLLRYVLYFTAIIFFSKIFFDVELGLKYYKYICLFATFFLVLQTVSFNFFGYYLPGIIKTDWFPVTSGQITNLERRLDLNLVTMYRPYSIFCEPAHYSEYVLGYLALSLFDANSNKKESFSKIFITIGILLSMSSTGILCGIGVWIIWFIMKFKNRISSVRAILAIILFTVGIFIVFRTEAFRYFIMRMEDGTSTIGRFGGYIEVYDEISKNFLSFLFGKGMAGVDFYLAGFGRLFMYFGLFGTLVFIICVLRLLGKINYRQKMLLVVFLALNLGTELLFQPIVLVFLPFVVLGMDRKAKDNEIINYHPSVE